MGKRTERQEEIESVLEKQVGVAVGADTLKTLKDIERYQRLKPAVLGRGLLEAAARFYEKHKHFSFPVVVCPAPPRASYFEEVQLMMSGTYADPISTASMVNDEAEDPARLDLLKRVAAAEERANAKSARVAELEAQVKRLKKSNP